MEELGQDGKSPDKLKSPFSGGLQEINVDILHSLDEVPPELSRAVFELEKLLGEVPISDVLKEAYETLGYTIGLEELVHKMNGMYFSPELKEQLIHLSSMEIRPDLMIGFKLKKDSSVYTTKDREKVLKIYYGANAESVKKYYELQNQCTGRLSFEVKDKVLGMNLSVKTIGVIDNLLKKVGTTIDNQYVGAVENIHIDIDTSSKLLYEGKGVYGIQDFAEGENLSESEYKYLYPKIKTELTQYLLDAYDIKLPTIAMMNIKVVKQESGELFLLVTDLGDFIDIFLRKNTN